MVLVVCVVAATLIANVALGTSLLLRYRAEQRPRPSSWARQEQVRSDLVRIIVASPDVETAVCTAQILFPDWTPEQARAKVLANLPPPSVRRPG